MVSESIEATHPILAVVSKLPLDIYPTLLHDVLPTTPITARFIEAGRVNGSRHVRRSREHLSR
jgi:hypothetical protein